jgi:hypothetical protein
VLQGLQVTSIEPQFVTKCLMLLRTCKIPILSQFVPKNINAKKRLFTGWHVIRMHSCRVRLYKMQGCFSGAVVGFCHGYLGAIRGTLSFVIGGAAKVLQGSKGLLRFALLGLGIRKMAN